MEVNKHQQIFSLLHDCLFGRPDGRMVLLARVQVVPVKVVCHGVKPVIASCTAIRVKAWNDLEDKVLPQEAGLLILIVSQEIKEAIEYEGAWCLARMHSGSQENYRFLLVEFHRAAFRVHLGKREQPSAVFRYRLMLLGHVVN